LICGAESKIADRGCGTVNSVSKIADQRCGTVLSVSLPSKGMEILATSQDVSPLIFTAPRDLLENMGRRVIYRPTGSLAWLVKR